MFSDIYGAIQASHVLQQRWREEAGQPRRNWLTALLHRATASK